MSTFKTQFDLAVADLIEIDEVFGGLPDDFILHVKGSYSPGTPDVWYLRNGDPGYPGDPPETEWYICDMQHDQLWEFIENHQKLGKYIEDRINNDADAAAENSEPDYDDYREDMRCDGIIFGSDYD